MSLDIVGAGMAGLLAANMLRHHDPVVIEGQPALPNNHSAVLRFRTSQVGDVLGIPFRNVNMIKATLPWKNPVADALAYSFKNTGVYRSDRSVIAGLTQEERFIAPDDLIVRMAERVKINFGTKYDHFDHINPEGTPVVSTVPMPVLMKALKYPLADKFQFTSVPGWNIRAKLKPCSAYISLMVPDPDYEFSRISITGDELIVELPNWAKEIEKEEPWMAGTAASLCLKAISMLGMNIANVSDLKIKRQPYAKINGIDDSARKEFIHWATDKYNIFSLGRFATWRPGLLLDDLVKDIRLIDKWLASKDRYAIAQHR